MGWKDLLQDDTETLVTPWLGGRSLQSGSRVWRIEGPLPAERGWSEFSLAGRKARFKAAADPDPESLKHKMTGYLVGDRLVPSDAPRVSSLVGFDAVRLIEPGLERFTRVSAGRAFEGGPLVYIQEEMPLGPEFEVRDAFLGGKESTDGIKDVVPALDAAFKMEVRQRREAERRRAEAEERRRLVEEERLREEQRQEIMGSLGDGESRRRMAQVDFETGARAALAIGGAEYLDHRAFRTADEMVVQFSIEGRRFECVCDARTLQIIESGICLTAEYDQDGFDRGTKGDSFFTLESLPPTILQAQREGKLVVFRHVD